MCSIQLLSNNIFSIPVSMKSLKLCLLMWLHYKKEHSLSGNRKKYALRIKQSQDIMNAEKDEHFSVGAFFLPHDTSLAEKFILYSITSGIVHSKMPTWLCSAPSYCSTRLPYFPMHVFTIPGTNCFTVNIFGTSYSKMFSIIS